VHQLPFAALEPIQTAHTLEGQIEELAAFVKDHGGQMALVGHSWGAMLSCLVAARYPHLVRKLILVGCGPFTAHHAKLLQPTRLSRLSPEERAELDEAPLARVADLFFKADSVDPIETPIRDPDLAAYEGVWPEVARLRESGKLAEWVAKIQCPITVIHGDYDPHPLEGVTEALPHVERVIILERCGHTPWLERHARDQFFEVLIDELTPKRIMIIGPPGSGKTTLSRRLSEELNLPLHHLDELFFEEGWKERLTEEFVRDHEAILAEPRWILDGNAHRHFAPRAAHADTLIYLRPPRLLCLYRVLRRGDWSFKLVKYLWCYHRRFGEKIRALKENYHHLLYLEPRGIQSLASTSSRI
jgi:dienelactone hydrolase